MGEEQNGVVPTGGEDGVGGGDPEPAGNNAGSGNTSDFTLEKPPVSTPKPVSTPNTGDAEKRIRDLQSRADKLQAQLEQEKLNHSKSIAERAELQKQLEKVRAELQQVLDQSNKTSEELMEKTKNLESENADLRAKLARTEFLLRNPDLADYAALIPVTDDQEELEQKAQAIRSANEKFVSSFREQIKTGVIPPTNPQRMGGNKPRTSEEINRYLKEAQGNPVEFERRLREVTEELLPT